MWPCKNYVPSAQWCSVLEVSLSTAFRLVGCTEKCRGSSGKRLTAQLPCRDCWKEPSVHWSLAAVSLQQAPFAAFFPHASLHTDQIALSHSWKILSFCFVFFLMGFLFLIRSVQVTLKYCPGNHGIVPIYVEHLWQANQNCPITDIELLMEWLLFEKQQSVYALISTSYPSPFPLESSVLTADLLCSL